MGLIVNWTPCHSCCPWHCLVLGKMMIEVEETKLQAEGRGPDASPNIASRTGFFRLWSARDSRRPKAAPVYASALDSTLEVGMDACPCVGWDTLRESRDHGNEVLTPDSRDR